MGDILGWAALIVAFVAVLVSFVTNLRERRQPTVDMSGLLDSAEGYIDETAEILSEGAEFVEQIMPAAKELVKGARQYYLTGELELEQLKPKVLRQLEAMFPDVDKERLEMAVESAVFGVKLVAREVWKRQTPEGDGLSPGLAPVESENAGA